MTPTTDKYKAAIVGTFRRLTIGLIFDLIDPDIIYSDCTSSKLTKYSDVNKLKDKKFEHGGKFVTLEKNRWLLDGTWDLLPQDEKQATDSMKDPTSKNLCDDDGVFSNKPWMQINFQNVDILQAYSVYFNLNDTDGIPEEFTVDVYSGEDIIFTKVYTENESDIISEQGFTVIDPTAIRVTVSKWGLGSRRMRAVEIVPGIYEDWTEDDLAELSITREISISNLTFPYDTCDLKMNNITRRFEPRNKSGVFKSIAERQELPLKIGVELEDGSVEQVNFGSFYQRNKGWTTSNNSIGMSWYLVDIRGLLANKNYRAQDTLPNTLQKWFESVLGQIGEKFASRFVIDESFDKSTQLTCSKDEVDNKKCGDILRYIAMAVGGFITTDYSTGFLKLAKLQTVATSEITLDNMHSYPEMQANDEVSSITFRLSGDSYFTVSGTLTASENTINVDNPFIRTQEKAIAASRLILQSYGGNLFSVEGRGDPSVEMGDIQNIFLANDTSMNGRIYKEELKFENYVVSKVPCEYIQADGSFLWEGCDIITKSGKYTAPAGKNQLRIILVQGGDGGYDGGDGTINNPLFGTSGSRGADGENGLGGKVFVQVIDINPGQEFDVHIGEGGSPNGGKGEETTFGKYSSANGQRYNGFADIQTGDVYGRDGVDAQPNTGDGGKGGAGGSPGYNEPTYGPDGELNGWTTISRPTPGEPGKPGGSGIAIVYYDISK